MSRRQGNSDIAGESPSQADHPARVTVWANGFGVWHVRVPRHAASALIAARRALRDELTAREANVSRNVWMHPVRVTELDDEDTIVYREGEGAPPTVPTLGPIHRRTGVAGQVAYSVDVTYTYGTVTETNRVTFVGNLYGTPGPVHVTCGPFEQFRVDRPERFGDRFSSAWVRRYYGRSSELPADPLKRRVVPRDTQHVRHHPEPTQGVDMSTSSTERAAEAEWRNGATVDAARAEHNSGAHDGAPSRFCTHRQCIRLSPKG